jgi:hypothetical protein
MNSNVDDYIDYEFDDYIESPSTNSPDNYPKSKNPHLYTLLDSVDHSMIQTMREEAVNNKKNNYFPSTLNPSVSIIIRQMREIMYPNNLKMHKTETTENPYLNNNEFSSNERLGHLIEVNGYSDLISEIIGMYEIAGVIDAFNNNNEYTQPIQIAVVNGNHFVPVFNCTDPIMAQAYDEIFGDNYQNTDEFDAEFPNIYPNIRIPYVRHSGDCGPHSLLYAFLVARVYRKNLNAPPSNSSSDLSFFSLRPSSNSSLTDESSSASNSSWTDVVSSKQQTRKLSNKKEKGKSMKKRNMHKKRNTRKKGIRILKGKRVTKKYK